MEYVKAFFTLLEVLKGCCRQNPSLVARTVIVPQHRVLHVFYNAEAAVLQHSADFCNRQWLFQNSSLHLKEIFLVMHGTVGVSRQIQICCHSQTHTGI